MFIRIPFLFVVTLALVVWGGREHPRRTRTRRVR